MDNNLSEASPNIPILNVAWERYAQFDRISFDRTRRHIRARRWIVLLGVLATLFAILTDAYPASFPALGGLALKFFLILTPIAGAVLAAFVNKFYGGGDFLVLRAGAEEILKEILTYRTILQGSPERRAWLEKRLADIQRTVYRGLGGEMVLKTYHGPLPPYYDPKDPNSDEGFADLSGQRYFEMRLKAQLDGHIKKVHQYQRERTWLQLGVLAAGGVGAILAAWGGPLTLWVAFSAAIALALIGWEALRNLDATVKNYSKVILELTILVNHWENLEPEERTDIEFYSLVMAAEDLLSSRNVEYIKGAMEVLAAVKDDEIGLVENVLRNARQMDTGLKQAMPQEIAAGMAAPMQTAIRDLRQQYTETMSRMIEEAGSERAQREQKEIEKAKRRGAREFSDRLKDLARENARVSLTRETPKEVLNAVLSQYPPSGDVKG